jgi:hypothetical protein
MSIAGFDGITAGIAGALTASKVFIASYSSWFTRPGWQWQWQWQWTTAFLAAQHETDPLHRILGISPEGGASQLTPVGLADVRFSMMPTTPRRGNRLTQPEARRAATTVVATRQDRGHGRPLLLHGNARPGRREIPSPRCGPMRMVLVPPLHRALFNAPIRSNILIAQTTKDKIIIEVLNNAHGRPSRRQAFSATSPCVSRPSRLYDSCSMCLSWESRLAARRYPSGCLLRIVPTPIKVSTSEPSIG